MKTTEHFKIRKRERGISDALLNLAFHYGEELSQNPTRIVFGETQLKNLKKQKRISKEEVLNAEKLLKGKSIVLVIDNCLITTFWANKRINRRYKQKHEQLTF